MERRKKKTEKKDALTGTINTWSEEGVINMYGHKVCNTYVTYILSFESLSELGTLKTGLHNPTCGYLLNM